MRYCALLSEPPGDRIVVAGTLRHVEQCLALVEMRNRLVVATVRHFKQSIIVACWVLWVVSASGPKLAFSHSCRYCVSLELRRSCALWGLKLEHICAPPDNFGWLA